MKKKKIAGLSAFMFVVLFAVIALFGFAACSYDTDEVPKFGGVFSNGSSSGEFVYPEGTSQRVFVPNTEDDEYDTAMTVGDAVFSVGDISINPKDYGNGNVIYWISGTSAQMTAEVAAWWTDGAEEGDDYITVKILVDEGETISYTTAKGETKTFTNGGTEDDGIDNGYLYLVIRLSGTYDDGSEVKIQSRYDFTITWTETVKEYEYETDEETGELKTDEDGNYIPVGNPVNTYESRTEIFYINVNGVSLSDTDETMEEEPAEQSEEE